MKGIYVVIISFVVVAIIFVLVYLLVTGTAQTQGMVMQL